MIYTPVATFLETSKNKNEEKNALGFLAKIAL